MQIKQRLKKKQPNLTNRKDESSILDKWWMHLMHVIVNSKHNTFQFVYNQGSHVITVRFLTIQ